MNREYVPERTSQYTCLSSVDSSISRGGEPRDSHCVDGLLLGTLVGSMAFQFCVFSHLWCQVPNLGLMPQCSAPFSFSQKWGLTIECADDVALG